MPLLSTRSGVAAVSRRVEDLAQIFDLSMGEEEIWSRLMVEVGARYGIDHALYGFTHSVVTAKRRGVTRSIYFRHNYPSQYVEAVGKSRFLDDDICTASIIFDHEPLLWSDADALATPEQKRRIELDEDFGMMVGASFALPFDEGRGVGGIGLCSRSRSEADFERGWREQRGEMEFLVHCFDAVMRGPMVHRLFQLPPRERDVLAYTAAGLGAKEIAWHLGIETKSVSNALARARLSMDAKTTAEAVAKAYVYRLI